MRLIDADALKRHKQLEPLGNGNYGDVDIVYAYDIDSAPTIDPVKHGVWENFSSQIGGLCSNCGFRCTAVDLVEDEDGGFHFHNEWRYCPNCGAMMDGEDE